MPSAQSDSWSGDAIALHFLYRKLANMLISVRNETPAGYSDGGNQRVFCWRQY